MLAIWSLSFFINLTEWAGELGSSVNTGPMPLVDGVTSCA